MEVRRAARAARAVVRALAHFARALPFVIAGALRDRGRWIDLDAPLPPRPVGDDAKTLAAQIAHDDLAAFVAAEIKVRAVAERITFNRLSEAHAHTRAGDASHARTLALASTARRQIAAAVADGDIALAAELTEYLRAAELLAAATEACSAPAYLEDEEVSCAETATGRELLALPPLPPLELRSLVRAPRAPGRVVPA